MSLADAIHALLGIIERARQGDRHAQKELAFPFRYGRTRSQLFGVCEHTGITVPECSCKACCTAQYTAHRPPGQA